MWLREILTAKEKAGGTRTDEHALLQDHLFRATDELCETRIEAAEMSSRCAARLSFVLKHSCHSAMGK